ncbi:MAG: hypothetical protein KBS66_02010 [Eubacterium sp.]|nr:hypothetical protein [Candidatus Colimonas fimequi]
MKNSKKGSSSVFLMLIIATLMTIVLGFMTGARNEYMASRSDGLINLAADSVMSEYDYQVEKEYGLFILGGRRGALENKMRNYIDFGLSDVRTVRTTSVSVSGSGYSLANCQQIENQIVDSMKYAQVQGLLDSKYKLPDEPNTMKEEVLRNGQTIVSLPSYDMPELSITSIAESLATGIKGPGEALKQGTDSYLINKYVMSHFNNSLYMKDENHFFRSEVEYVLGGKLSDKENDRRVDMAIVAMRFPLNMKYLLTDKAKMEELLAAAEVLTPEAAPVTQMILASSWAYMESDNDVKLLRAGYKIPISKDSLTWAVDIDSLLDGLNEGMFKPEVNRGNDYGDYLQMLLFATNSDIKMARIMDLIQINMRMNYDSTFVMGEHCVGLHVSAKVNGRKFSYEKMY